MDGGGEVALVGDFQGDVADGWLEVCEGGLGGEPVAGGGGVLGVPREGGGLDGGEVLLGDGAGDAGGVVGGGGGGFYSEVSGADGWGGVVVFRVWDVGGLPEMGGGAGFEWFLQGGWGGFSRRLLGGNEEEDGEG